MGPSNEDLSLKQLSAWDIGENINCLDSRAAVKIFRCSVWYVKPNA